MPLRVRARQFQFTPLREGRRDKHQFIPQRLISIHAPPRGATSALSKPINLGKISIHAPPRGATRRSQGTIPYALFQFTPLREGRRVRNFIKQRRRVYFNSRPSARGDGIAAPALLLAEFQFTPLREGRRPVVHLQFLPFYNFNSRPSARGDRREAILFLRLIHFNSRPSARGDNDGTIATAAANVFQFTPLREGRPYQQFCHFCLTLFQFTPLREGRPLAAEYNPIENYISIHAPPRGATVYKIWFIIYGLDFNSRPSARGD